MTIYICDYLDRSRAKYKILAWRGYPPYTYIMCLPFGAHFQEFWYIDGWIFITDKSSQISSPGVCAESTQFEQNCMISVEGKVCKADPRIKIPYIQR